MGLVGDHSEALALRGRQLLNRLQGEGEGLDGADNDLLAVRQGLSQLTALAARVALDGFHHTGGPLEIEQGVLQLAVDDIAVRHHNDRAEQLLVLVVVQFRQEVGGPGDGVGLARSGRVLDQELAPGALCPDGGLQLLRHVQLVIAREDDRLDLGLVLLGDQITTQDFQPGVLGPDLFPQIGCRVTKGAGRIALAPLIPAIEGQEPGGLALQLGGHHDLGVRHRKMHQCAGRKTQQGFDLATLGRGVAVKPVLRHSVIDALGEVGLQLHRGYGQAVEEEDQINGVLVG